MIRFMLKSWVLAAGLTVVTASALADLTADRTIVNNNGNATVTVTFPVPLSGDLYLATVVNGEYLFFADQGKTLSKTVVPFQKDGFYDTPIKVLEVSSFGMPANTYPLYEVVTKPDTDPLNFSNWIGGLGGLHKMKFTIGISNAIAGDANGDGFLDDDADHDGYSDDHGGAKCAPIAARDRKHKEDNDDNEGNDDNDDHRQTRYPAVGATGTTQGSCNQGSALTPSPGNSTPSTISASPSSASTVTTSTTSAAASGSALFKSNCGSCHSTKPRVNTVSQIRNAMNSVGSMRSLSGMSDVDLQAIADYLKTTAP